jgi:hypothetical protein
MVFFRLKCAVFKMAGYDYSIVVCTRCTHLRMRVVCSKGRLVVEDHHSSSSRELVNHKNF